MESVDRIITTDNPKELKFYIEYTEEMIIMMQKRGLDCSELESELEVLKSRLKNIRNGD